MSRGGKTERVKVECCRGRKNFKRGGRRGASSSREGRGRGEEACDVCGVRVIVARHQRGRERERGILVVRRGVISLGCKRRLVFFFLLLFVGTMRESLKLRTPRPSWSWTPTSLSSLSASGLTSILWRSRRGGAGMDACLPRHSASALVMRRAREDDLPYCIYKAQSRIQEL